MHITWLPRKNFKMIIDGEVYGQFWSDNTNKLEGSETEVTGYEGIRDGQRTSVARLCMVSSTVYRKNADKRATLWVTVSNVAAQGQCQSSDSARVRLYLHWQAVWLRLLLNVI
jgi:hypothetical protein